jgi:cell division septation protein DedD
MHYILRSSSVQKGKPMNNERGGIISNILIVPIGIGLMIGIFFLGYYVGSTRAKAAATGEPLPPLPDMLAQQMPKPEEFTFYKTLTEKENKTVSIDVKPRPAETAPQAAKRETSAEIRSKPDAKAEIKPSPPATGLKPAPAAGKLRYTIQLASYPEKGLAEEEVKNKKKQGYAAFIVAFNQGKSTWYRVRLGRFADRDAAERLLKELKSKEGGSAFITLE